MKPLCFVLMPFGKKKDAAGKEIDFNAVYKDLIRPAIIAADMEPLRADEEVKTGIIHRPMFERLILCDYAIADLTTANANVFYELGVRHGVRPGHTVTIFGEGTNLPFDVTYLRCVPYAISETGVPLNPKPVQEGITKMLKAARDQASDSPVFDLVKDLSPGQVGHESTDVMRERLSKQSVAFQDRVQQEQQLADKLTAARQLPKAQAIPAIRAVEDSLGPLLDAPVSAVIDLMLSYRAAGATDQMVRIEPLMSVALRRTVMVREQFAFALNREKRSAEAEKVLTELIQSNGPSSESYGLLGRIYKDRWQVAFEADKRIEARGHLTRALDAYTKGFEADMRDAYPGINTVTLMEMGDQVDPRQAGLLPVVRYAVERRMSARTPDYWDWATVVELEVLAANPTKAIDALGQALTLVREHWEPRTTARNLGLIRKARTLRNTPSGWVQEIEEALEAKAVEMEQKGKGG